MAKLIKKSPKRFLAILIAVILVMGMIPATSLFSVFAATQTAFTVEIDGAISGAVQVTLTNSANASETQTEPAVAGVATFNNFVDSDKLYNIIITGMNERGDFYDWNKSFGGESIFFSLTDGIVFSITTSAGANGTITLSKSAIPYGHSRTITATASTGYKIDKFTVDGNEIAGAADRDSYDHPFNDINANHTVDVTFVPKVWAITFSFNSDGTIEDDLSNNITNGGKITANQGDSPSFTATANTTYHVSSVIIDGTPQTDGTFDNAQITYSYTFPPITQNHLVTVTFLINTYDVTISSVGNGSITPAESPQKVGHGSSLSLNILPDEGYMIDLIMVDGDEVDDDDPHIDDDYTYTFTNVTAAHNISVTFVPIIITNETEEDLFSFNHSHKIDYYETATQRIYIFKNNATVTFSPAIAYKSIQFDGFGFGSSHTLNSSKTITAVSVSTSKKGKKGTKIKTLDKDIVIIIDKTAPIVAEIPEMDWTNQDYTVSGYVTDENTTEAPSSGLSRVVWSKTPLSIPQVLAETTNAAAITGETYSFTITEEQNDETFYVYAIDRADNVSAAETVNIKIDKTPPEITGFIFRMIEPPPAAQILNFLHFGTFSNDKIEVEVFARDEGISSGLNEITLYNGNGSPVKTESVTDSSAKFTLTLSDFSNNEISASVTDNAGNDSADIGCAKPTDIDVTSNAFSDKVILKTEAPTVSILPESNPKYINDAVDPEENWYNGDVGFAVNAETESVGLYSVVIKINDVEIINDTDFSDSLIPQRTYAVNTGDNHLDGENTIDVIVVNNCGVEKSDSKTVFIDTTNPKVTEFNIDKENDDDLGKVLNFLTFGNFFNEKVKVTIVADDRYGATSGIKTVTLFADGKSIDGSPKKVTAVGDGTYKAEFVFPSKLLPETKLFDAVLSAVATDNVGNITGKSSDNPDGVPVTPGKVNSDLDSNRLMIETVNPVIDISSPKAVHIDGNKKKWYPNDVLFTVTAEDTDAGIRSVRIKINDVEIKSDVNGKAVDADFYTAQTHKEIFKINTKQGKRADDGSYLIEVTVVDNAGNSYSASDIVYKDTDKPSVTGFRFVPATSDGISETSEFIKHLEYGFYFKKEFTVIIEVSDPDPSSGLAKVGYRFVSHQNGEKTDEIRGTQDIVDGMAVLSVPKDFKGQIFVEAFDNVENKSRRVTPQAFVVDKTKPEIDITNNDATSHIDANGNKLYVLDMSFSVVVSDYVSGIKEIGYSQSSENGSYDREVIPVNNTGYSIGDDLGDGWTVSEMDANLVTKATKKFAFSSDDNDIVLTLDATDRSGNKKKEVHSEKVTIDKTPPIINVVFRDDKSKNQYYYSANRVADISVIERNFDAGLIKTEIENKFGSVPGFSFTEISNTEHVAVIDFDEGDYTFDVTGTDLGDHKATVNFSGGNEHLFFVDKTKPAIEENFIEFEIINPSFEDKNNSFNVDKTINIKITEHNFEPALANLIVTRKDAGEEHDTNGLVDATYEVGSARWESSGDVHTISFTLDSDAVYQVEITPTDLAGNTADKRNTVVFEIDKTAPVVSAKNGAWVKEDDTEFFDVYPFLRKDDPAPTVEFEDLNIDHIKYDLTVYIPDYTSSQAATVIRPVKVYLDEDTDKSGKIRGGKFTLPDFVQDGIYAVELIAVDIAGNESLLNKNTYARMIEQDVLAYILESNLAEKTGLYSFQYENGDAISKKPDNFSDIKIFALAKNDTGVDIVLRDNDSDETDTNAQTIADDSVYGVRIYNFILKSSFFQENFEDDTDVELHLTAKNEENRIDLGKLHIDNVAPTCVLPKEFDSWRWYFGEEDQTITVSNISEMLDENEYKVYDNGKEINREDLVYSADAGTLTFTLEKGWHNVGIIISDMAGNANHIQEKANIHIGFFWLWIIAASSISVIAVIAFITMRNIRAKRKLENE